MPDTTQLTTLSALPDEALELVIYYLQHTSLVSLSLVSRRFSSLARPQLWSSLDLGKRDAQELESMFSDLFPSTRSGEQSKGLANLHIKTVQVQMLEDLAALQAHHCHDEASDEATDNLDEELDQHCCLHEEAESGVPELLQRQEWVDESLRAISSIGIPELELCMVESSDMAPFDNVFLPALQQTLEILKAKVGSIEVWIDAFGLCEHNQEGASRATRKLSAILSSFPPALLTSVHVNGIHLDKTALEDSLNIQQVMSSSILRSLTLKETGGSFSAWQPSHLRSLTLSWTADNSATDLADLQVAFQFMRLSASTLESLILQNIMAVDYAGIDFGHHIKLPELLILTVADCQLGPGSVLHTMLEWTAMPKLKMLELETEDIVSPALSHLPDALPALRFLRLTEGRMRATGSSDEVNPSSYEATVKACERAGVNLKTNYNCLRCETGEDLESELGRIATISGQLTGASMACTSGALLNLKTAEIVDLPVLKKLSIGITDFAYTPQEGESAATADISSFKHFVQLLSAPLVDDLQITLFVQGNDCSFLAELREVLEEGQFPHLNKLGGAVLAGQGTSISDFRQQEDHVRQLCIELGVESSSLRFMSREDLMGQAEADEEDWIDEDDEHDSSSEFAGEEDQEEHERSDELGLLDMSSAHIEVIDLAHMLGALEDDGTDVQAVTGIKKAASVVSLGDSDGSWATEDEDSEPEVVCCCSHQH